MHSHLDTGASMPGPRVPGQEPARDARGNLKQMLEWGFTTVFSTSHSNVDLREFAELRRAAHEDPGLPRYFGAGRAISVAARHASQPRFATRMAASRRRAGGGSIATGARWQIVPAMLDELMTDADHGRTKRVADAMLKMVKLDIAALTVAAR